MKVIKKNDAKTVDFKVVAAGECFQYLGLACLKMREIIDEDGCVYNAVDVSDGESLILENTDQVIPLKAQIVIESM